MDALARMPALEKARLRDVRIVHVSPGASPARRSDRRVALGLALLAATLFFSRLPCGLLEPEEARYAEIARQMLAEGRWLVPVWHGEDYLHKPPLFYWLIMAAYVVFGVHDWAARLVPCLAGIGIVLVCYFWARRFLGRRAGLAAALVLLLSGRFLYLQGMILFDGLLAFWVTLALATGHVALAARRFSWPCWLISAAACGLGVMTKGPVAEVLIGAPLAAIATLSRKRSRGISPWLAYASLTLAVAGPWLWYLACTRPDALAEFVWLHNVQRFVEPLDHEKPWWFYLPALFVGMLPWSLWLLVAWGKGFRTCGTGAPRILRALNMIRASRLTPFWLAAGCCLLFFSLSGCKRAAYVLPAYGGLAIALGYHVSQTRWLFPRESVSLSRPRCAGSILTARGWLLFVAMFLLLETASVAWSPAYHQEFGMREALAPVRQMPGPGLHCYPRHWDSLSFYIRGEVKAYADEEIADLLTDLRKEETAWLIVRRRDGLAALMAHWPADLEFHPQWREHPNVVVALVVRR